jgi:DNA modification methylase
MPSDIQPYLSPDYQSRALAELLARHGTRYESATDDYDRPPFSEDIKEGKNDTIYNAHSYHTKVPPRSIIPYILHYTKPGDVILDPFCGSGMTGVAAQMCANPPGDLLAQFPDLKERVGPRVCILNDLSPAACHIAYNYNTPVDVDKLRSEFERIKASVKDEFDWLYGTEHYEPAVGQYSPKKSEVHSRLKNPPAEVDTARLIDDSVERTWELLTLAEVESRLGYPVTGLPRADDWGELDVTKVQEWVCIPGVIQYTIWSDVYRCEGLITVEEPTGKVSTRGKNAGKPMIRKTRVSRGCGNRIVLWEDAVDQETGDVHETFNCPKCGQLWKKTQIARTGTEPVVTNYKSTGIKSSGERKNLRHSRDVTARELSLLSVIAESGNPYPSPSTCLDVKGPQYRRNALGGRGFTTISDFYTLRNFRALAALWAEVTKCEDARIRCALQFAFTAILFRVSRRRIVYSVGPGKGWASTVIGGTLYIPSLTAESHVGNTFENKCDDILNVATNIMPNVEHVVTCSHSARLKNIQSESIDYIFADPPFGSNIYYAEMNRLFEAWLETFTDEPQEAVVHRKEDGGRKTLDDYKRLMTECFEEIYRILKPNRFATVEFNNSDGAVFEAIKEAIRESGFEIVNMLLLDKEHKTFKQVKGAEGTEDVVDKDVLFNLQKPAKVLAFRKQEDHDLEHQVADAVSQHLLSLPSRIEAEPTKYSDDHRTTATINSMLMNSLIPRGVSVEQLNLPFIERVCSRYFRKIGQHWYRRGEAVAGTGSEGLFEEEVSVKDDLSAINWLRQRVRERPMLVGELKPLWMRATGLLAADISQSLVLEDLLAENFWRDQDTNRWREPTEEERERMNDDRSTRVLHDAERYFADTLRRQTTDAERCEWIDVLFKACRQVEEGDVQSTPTLRDFDIGEGYRLITRLFQSVLRDHVSADEYSKASKQASVASNRVAEGVRQDEAELAALRKKKERKLFD